jgi:hypothetical protein
MNLSGWVGKTKARKKKQFHTKCFPAPYCGDLDNAKVILLLLNPGLSYTNYHLEREGTFIRKQNIGCLDQNFVDKDFPFHWLNPANCNHEGFIWWERKLRKTLQVIATKRFKGNYFEALKIVSKTIAAVELVPYHSKASPNFKKVSDLPSVDAAKKFVIETIESKLEQVVVVLRSEKLWELEKFTKKESSNVKVCKNIASQSISLGPDSIAGNEILKTSM